MWLNRVHKDPERPVEPPAGKDYNCPVCGAENPEKIYEVPGQGAVGCDECLCAYEPWEYFENREGL